MSEANGLPEVGEVWECTSNHALYEVQSVSLYVSKAKPLEDRILVSYQRMTNVAGAKNIPSGLVFTRPLSEFLEKVGDEPRFKRKDVR